MSDVPDELRCHHKTLDIFESKFLASEYLDACGWYRAERFDNHVAPWALFVRGISQNDGYSCVYEVWRRSFDTLAALEASIESCEETEFFYNISGGRL